jgi:hypothetical protein
MPRKGAAYRGISIKEEFVTTIEEFIKQHPELGYRSLSYFFEDATRRRLEVLKLELNPLPRLELINLGMEGVKIFDRQVREVIQIHFNPEGVKCGYHKTNNCEHVVFALKQPDIVKMLKQKMEEG